MTQGVTGTFAINGTELLLPPTTHSWVDRELVGTTGEGRSVYSSLRQYQLEWDLMPMDAFSQLVGFFDGIQNSGSIAVDLPKYATAPFQFYTYSGCQLREPTAGKFFLDHVSDVKLLIVKVRS